MQKQGGCGACIQDPVHIAVKLKSRLIRPFIILPLGRYLVGVHHLLLVHTMFGGDLHGTRGHNLYHKHKQDFDAVVHIISKLLEDLPANKYLIQMTLLPT